jgi:hypothetical protein
MIEERGRGRGGYSRTERWFECNQESEPMPVYTLDLISQRHQHADSRANRLSQDMKWNAYSLRIFDMDHLILHNHIVQTGQ